MENKDTHEKQQCPDFNFFGATYPDATCIDGYLWDLDKCDDGQLYGGGDEPCPFCNTEEFAKRHLEDMTPEEVTEYITKLRQKYGP